MLYYGGNTCRQAPAPRMWDRVYHREGARVNNKQAIVLWIVVLLIAVTGLMPPWYEVIQNDSLNVDIDKRECLTYHPIFAPPQKNFQQFGLVAPDPQSPDYKYQQQVYAAVQKKLGDSYHVGIDTSRLGVEWGAIFLVGLGLFFLLADRKRRELAPKERMSYLERMKRAGGVQDAPALDMALDDTELAEDDAPTASDPKHVFSDDEL